MFTGALIALTEGLFWLSIPFVYCIERRDWDADVSRQMLPLPANNNRAASPIANAL